MQNANGIRSIAFSPDGTLALVGGEWTPLTLIKVASGEAAFEFSTPAQRPPPTPSPYRPTARPPWSENTTAARFPSTICQASFPLPPASYLSGRSPWKKEPAGAPGHWRPRPLPVPWLARLS